MRPNPNAIHPNPALKSMCFIKNVVKAQNVLIGDYTYYDDEETLGVNFERDNILFNWPQFGDKLMIGKFCAIANGTKFLMGSANHRMGSFSTYPFNVLGGTWADTVPHLSELPFKGDTIVGNDVWFGRDCFILPGAKVGDGAIIGAKSVVAGVVEPYSVYVGNPARKICERFSLQTKTFLTNLRWWDFDIELIERIMPLLASLDTDVAQEKITKILTAKGLTRS